MNGKQLTISFITLLICAFLIRETAFSQADSSSKANTASSGFYVEVLGQSCSLLSINYELVFSTTTLMEHKIAMRIGIGYGVFLYSIPLTVSYVTGRKHNLECGAGLVYLKWCLYMSLKKIFSGGPAGDDPAITRYQEHNQSIWVIALGAEWNTKLNPGIEFGIFRNSYEEGFVYGYFGGVGQKRVLYDFFISGKITF